MIVLKLRMDQAQELQIVLHAAIDNLRELSNDIAKEAKKDENCVQRFFDLFIMPKTRLDQVLSKLNDAVHDWNANNEKA